MSTAENRAASHRSLWKQWAACISATLSMVTVGTVYGWTTTMIPRLTSNSTNDDIPVRLTSDESSWVISITAIGSMLGPFYGVYIAANYGRKLCLLQTAIFYISGWLLVVFARSAQHLYASRLILGFGVGASYTANPMYLSEVSDVKIRGAVGSLVAVSVFAGSLLACSLAPWTSYRMLSLILLCIPVLFVLSFVCFPESPYYLLSKGKRIEAARAITFFKGISEPEELAKELDDVKTNMGEEGNDLKFSLADVFLLKEARNAKALAIVMVLILGQQLSGSFSTLQYLEQMFSDAKIGISSEIATIIVAAVGFISGTISTLTVDGAGRRPLLLAASLGCAVTLCVLGVYLMLSANGTDVSSANLLPVIDVIVYQVIYQIGLGTMAYLLVGELFPTNVKGIAGAIITIFDGLLEFVITKMYEVIFTNVGSHAIYLFFSFSCFVLFVFVYAFVPETKGKTFQEIQNILAELRPFKVSVTKNNLIALS